MPRPQPGAYFITIVTYQRDEIFGEVVNGVIQLSPLGQVAWDEWMKTAQLRPYVQLFEDEFVVMPQQGHGGAVPLLLRTNHPQRKR